MYIYTAVICITSTYIEYILSGSDISFAFTSHLCFRLKCRKIAILLSHTFYFCGSLWLLKLWVTFWYHVLQPEGFPWAGHSEPSRILLVFFTLNMSLFCIILQILVPFHNSVVFIYCSGSSDWCLCILPKVWVITTERNRLQWVYFILTHLLYLSQVNL